MMIVSLSRQSINCSPKAIVCGCKEVRGTFVLDFHIGGLIVSCGWLVVVKRDQIWVLCE